MSPTPGRARAGEAAAGGNRNFGLTGPQLMAPGGGTPAAAAPAPPFAQYILAPCSAHSIYLPECAPGDQYLLSLGTSMAAPHVSGAAALVDSVAPGSWRAGQLMTRLLRGADDLGRRGADPVFSHGRLNVRQAVER